MGTHSELLRQRGHYYRLYTQQFRRELEREYNPFGPGEVAYVEENGDAAAVSSPTTALAPA
jgi:hypothetical protein